jgi:hypothetical protein
METFGIKPLSFRLGVVRWVGGLPMNYTAQNLNSNKLDGFLVDIISKQKRNMRFGIVDALNFVARNARDLINK